MNILLRYTMLRLLLWFTMWVQTCTTFFCWQFTTDWYEPKTFKIFYFAFYRRNKIMWIFFGENNHFKLSWKNYLKNIKTIIRVLNTTPCLHDISESYVNRIINKLIEISQSTKLTRNHNSESWNAKGKFSSGSISALKFWTGCAAINRLNYIYVFWDVQCRQSQHSALDSIISECPTGYTVYLKERPSALPLSHQPEKKNKNLWYYTCHWPIHL